MNRAKQLSIRSYRRWLLFSGVGLCGLLFAGSFISEQNPSSAAPKSIENGRRQSNTEFDFLSTAAFHPYADTLFGGNISDSEVARKLEATYAYGKLPLEFESNEGQTDGRVKFLARTSGFTLFLTAQETVMVQSKPATRPRPDQRRSGKRIKSSSSDARTPIRILFIGANQDSELTGTDELPGKANYFIGNDPARWRSNISTYAKVQYKDLYKGIDLVYYGNHRQVEYDFIVQPDADPNRILFGIRGAKKIEIDDQGDLVLQTANGPIRQKKPVVYQEIDGNRIEIAGTYALRGRHRVGFELGNYDISQPLVIDPTLIYSTYLGGTGDDQGDAIAVDCYGNAYVTGSTRSTDFPTKTGSYDTSQNGSEDVFVTKLNSTGSALVYSTYLGGTLDEPYWGASIAVDRYGKAYVAGTTTSADFPTTSGAYDRIPSATIAALGDAFVTKLNSNGNGLVYSTYLGGEGQDGAYYVDAIALDQTGKAYISGFTDSVDFPTTAGAWDITFNGPYYDAFVTKLNASGSALVYSTYLGGTSDDDATGIAVDGAGRAYVTGYTSSLDFPTTSGAYQPANNGSYDAFVTKLNSTGTGLVYSSYLGGTADDIGSSVAVDWAGRAHVAGQTASLDFDTTAGAFDNTFNGGSPFEGDVFVTKFNSSGSGLVYSTYLGGTVDEISLNVAVDSGGQAYVTGFTNSPDYPTTSNVYDTTFNGAGPPWFYGDVFVTKLNSQGSDLAYSSYVGGLFDDVGSGINLDGNGKVYLTGSTNSLDYPTTPGAFDVVYNGAGPPWFYGDAFVTKLDTGRGECPSQEDSDHDGLIDSREAAYFDIVGNPDSNLNGIKDGNDDSNGNGIADEDEDDNQGCKDRDSDGNGVDDEDEDDNTDNHARIFVNDFERPGDDTPAHSWYDNPPGTIHRTPSGYNSPTDYADGISSAHGNWHARLQDGGCDSLRLATDCYGPFTYWGKTGGINPLFPSGGYTTWVDVYLDVAWAAGKVDYRFDWSSAINNSTGTHQRDFVFNVGTPLTSMEATTAPGFYVNASTNATRSGAFPENPCPAPSTPPNSCRSPVKITQSGWYTFQHRFRPQNYLGTDYLAVDFIVSRHNIVVASWTISVVPVDMMTVIGGDRYGWFVINEINDLAIDCTVLGPLGIQHPPLGVPCTSLAPGGGRRDDDDDSDGDRDYDDRYKKEMHDRHWGDH